MVKYGILSDTHMSENDDPAVVQNLLDQLTTIFRDVDEIVHAGDIVDIKFLKNLENIAPVKVVRGNMDESKDLEIFMKFSVGDYTIGVIHELPENLEDFVKSNKLQVLIHGHTHQPMIENTPYNALLVNPGSPTQPKAPPQKRGFAKPYPRSTVLTLNIDKDNILTTFIITLKI